jgi:hypothetical protein
VEGKGYRIVCTSTLATVEVIPKRRILRKALPRVVLRDLTGESRNFIRRSNLKEGEAQ